MIQRIQTVFLIITLSALAVQLSTPLIRSSVADTSYFQDSILYLREYLPSLVLLMLTLSIVLISIFLFNNRKLQKTMLIVSGLSILATNLVIGVAFLTPTQNLMQVSNASISPGIGAFMPIIALICLVFAYRGITKDDKIVKSMDRLR